MSNGDLTVSYKYEDKRFKHGNETSELENETSELEEETSKHAWDKTSKHTPLCKSHRHIKENAV